MIGLPTKLYQWLILGLLFPIAFLNGWLALRVIQYFQPLVTIFTLTILLTFVLNYPVQFLQQKGFKRNYAVLAVFLPTLVILIALGITLVPFLKAEFDEIAKVIPQWFDSGYQQVRAFDTWADSRGLPINLSQLVAQLSNRLPNELQYFTDRTLSLALGTIDSISEILVTLVLTFYTLLDGERLWKAVFQRLPSNLAFPIQQSLQQNFQNYFSGQIVLAALMGFSMTVMFLVLNVRFGLIFGLGIGLMSLIPFGDVASLSLICLLVTLHNFWLGVKIAVAAVAIDQTIDQLVAPRLLGQFTGLRPVWVLVALLVGTNIGGLLGLLVAVPVASLIKSAIDGWEDYDISLANAVESTAQLDSPEKTGD